MMRLVLLQLAIIAVMLIGSSTRAAAEANKPASKRARELSWKDCPVSEPTPTVRTVKCADAELRFMRAPTMKGEQGVRTFLANLGLSAPVQTLKIGDKQVSYAVSADPKSPLLVASPLQELLVVCHPAAAPVTDPCFSRIAWMLTHGLPPGVTFPAPNMRFADVALQVPEGCTMRGAERIVCQSGSLDFREEKPRPHILEALQNLYAASGLQIKGAQQHPCSLGKHPGEGRVLDVAAHNMNFTVMICVAQAGARSLAAQCIGADPRTQQGYPVPCNQVFH